MIFSFFYFLNPEEDLKSQILLPENFDLELDAIEQFVDFANYVSPNGQKVQCSCATPDFHKGSNIPVGSVISTPNDMVIPAAIGTDINCGMRLHHTGLRFDEFFKLKSELIKVLKGDLLEGTRNIPTTGKSMQALFQLGLSAFWQEIKKNSQGIFEKIDYEKVVRETSHLHASSFCEGDIKYAPEGLMKREILRDPSLATLGGGNHFLEFQIISEIKDKQKAYENNLKVGDVVYMIHTGSRDVGFYVGGRWMDKAKESYPKGIKHPSNKVYCIEGKESFEYIKAMNSAAHYATANRALLAEIVRQRIKEVYKKDDDHMITDVPHNIIIQENNLNVHRKGATPAYQDQLLLIPGSMGHSSFLMCGLGNYNWLSSASHGAGRKMSRNEISFKSKKNKDILGLDGIECITLKEERKIEEAPNAYKNIDEVVNVQIQEKMVQPIAVFKPIMTFKA